jgi:hypothetical protein
MTIKRFAVAALCTASLSVLPATAEDLTISYRTTGAGSTGTATSYFSAERMRTTDAERDTIVEYASGRIVSVDHGKKEYSEMTLSEIETAMKAATAQMDAQMASLPPAMREKMQQMTGGGTVTVTKGGTKKVAGYDCQDHVVAMGAMGTMHVCATTAIAPPAPNVDFRRFASFAGVAANPMLKNLAAEMQKIQGFTLAESSSMKMMGRAVESSKEATEVKRGPIPPATFDVAALTKGYKKVASPTARLGK